MVMHKISQIFKKLVSARDIMLAEVNSMSPQQQQFRSSADAWSALDIVNHLVVSEQATFQFIAIHRDPTRMPQRRQWHHSLRLSLMMFALKSPLKFKMPSRLPNPQTQKELSLLRSEWLEIQEKLSQYAQHQTDDFFNLPVFRHPIFGTLDFCATLLFLTEHINHHVHQIQRLRKAENFPAKVLDTSLL